MQKKLIAMAVAALASTGAMAQVTMYGILDAGVVHYSGDAGATKNDKNRMMLSTGFINGNRIGFKGEEDLGDGMKGYAQAEFGFAQDTNSGITANRQTFVGLSGGFGDVRLGRQYSPMFNVIAAVDPYGTSGLGAVGSAAYGTASIYDIRVDNAVQYTKAFGPVSLQAQTGFGEVDGDGERNRVDGLSVTYSQGPLLVAAVYQGKREVAAKVTDHTRTLVGGTFNAGVVKVGAAFGVFSADTNNNVGKVDTDFVHLGATVPVGKGNILVAMNQVKPDSMDGFMQVGVGYHHNFAKRTIGYVQYGMVDSDDANVQLLGSGHGTGLVVGLRHAF